MRKFLQEKTEEGKQKILLSKHWELGNHKTYTRLIFKGMLLMLMMIYIRRRTMGSLLQGNSMIKTSLGFK